MSGYLELKPSRLLVILVVAVHVAAAFSFTYGLSSVWMIGTADSVIAASLFWSVSRALACSGTLEVLPEGCVRCSCGGVAGRELRLLPATVVWSDAIWLLWTEGNTRGASVLLRDQMSSEDWRGLQVWLRLKVGQGMSGQDGCA